MKESREVGVLRLIGYYALSSIIASITVRVLENLLDCKLESRIIGITIQLLTITFILCYERVSKEKLKSNIKEIKEKNTIKEIAILLIFLYIFSLASIYILVAIFYKISPQKLTNLINEQNFKIDTTTQLFIVSIYTVIIVPIFEELVFRKIIFKRFSKNIGILLAATISSIMFGMLHCKLSVIHATVFGFIICILYEKYNNILIPILLHSLNNLVPASMSTLSFYKGTLYMPVNVDLKNDLVLSIIAFIISSIFLGMYVYKNKEYLKDKSIIVEKVA